ncbi:MAG: membrane dipeptidase [Firmicutes bacterium]|nr:membrane dipeptidase [Bacillota bacterium]
MNYSKKDFFIIDGHCDTVHHFRETKGYNFSETNSIGHIDLPRLKEGGISLQFFALFVEPEYKPFQALQRTLQLAEHFLCEMGKNSEQVKVIRTLQDLEEAMTQQKLGALMTLEGAEALEGGVEILQILYRLGLRGVGLTWNQRNGLADGVDVGAAAGGLTKLGKRMVQEMNRLGIIVDGAHIAPRGFFDLLETSTKPIVITHANAAALCSHPRNLTDEQLRALRDHGGVVGLTFFPDFIAEKGQATLAQLLDHFCYIADHFGIDILAIGADYDGIETTVEELSDVSKVPLLLNGLLERGFSKKEVQKIAGENLLNIVRNTLPREEKIF